MNNNFINNEELLNRNNIKYSVMEIFESIQGEGSMMGFPVTFIRMNGCNLSCAWCDTKASWKKVEPNMTISEIVARCKKYFVVITGGEPCCQELEPLIDALHDEDIYVAIETNGTKPTPRNADWVVCSPKPMMNYAIHRDCRFNELKYVIDENFKLEYIPERLVRNFGLIWLQPCDYGKGQEQKTQASIKKCVDLAMQNNMLRVGVQLHKVYNLK